MPLLSVIVPVYNAEALLRKCTDSILAQRLGGMELLLVNDGSSDGSGALCDAIAAEDARVRVFHKENGGVSSARNLGLREARGDYIAFADADDWWAPHAFETLYQALAVSGADTAGCAHYNVFPNGEARAEAGALPPGLYGPPEIKSGILDRLLGHRLEAPGQPVLNGFIWRFLFSRAIIAAHDISFDGAYLEDELFLLTYFYYSKALVMIDTPLYHYLQNPNSVTHRYLPDYIDTFGRFMEKKRALAARFSLDVPGWEASSNWAGLFIAIANEHAPGNPASNREKTARTRAFAQRPDMAAAIRALTPRGLSRNKQVVATLVRRGWFGLLTLLYTVKNRGR
ncbi:MAG: glycosyltransferase [Clostridiales bacterium]|nr:glycosyltransferase [Clostridiales bacterium]